MRVAFEQRLLENDQLRDQREHFFIVRRLLSEHFYVRSVEAAGAERLVRLTAADT